MTLQRIGIVVHEGKAVARDTARTVREWAAQHGIPVVGVDVWHEAESGDDGGTRRNARDEAAEAGYPDLIVTIGGDGTFLRGARIAAVTEAAVLGVDVGRVGFLTEVGVDDLTRALDAVRDETAIIEERLTLNMRASRPMEIPPGIEGFIRYGRGPKLPPPPVRASLPDDVGWGVGLDVMALNDVVFEKLARDRQASLAVYVANRLFALKRMSILQPMRQSGTSTIQKGSRCSFRLQCVIAAQRNIARVNESEAVSRPEKLGAPCN